METWLDSGLSVLSMCVSVAWHRQSRVAVDSGVQHQELREEGATTTTAHNTTTTLVPVWPDPSPSIGTSPPIPQAVKYFLCDEKLFWWLKATGAVQQSYSVKVGSMVVGRAGWKQKFSKLYLNFLMTIGPLFIILLNCVTHHTWKYLTSLSEAKMF